jgi:hypothetical protein
MTQEMWGGAFIIGVLAIMVTAWLAVHVRNRNPNAFRPLNPLTDEERIVLHEAVLKHRKEQREQSLQYINECIEADNGKGWTLLSDEEVEKVRSAFSAAMLRRYDY